MDLNNLVLAVIAIATATSGFFQWRIAMLARETRAISAATKEIAAKMQVDIAVVEKSTNSMKDALVQATADANLLKGRAEVIAEVAAAKVSNVKA